MAQPSEVRKLHNKVKKYETRRLINRAYLGPLVIILVIVGLAVWKGWSQKPAVTVEFNVGEIIAGILVGAGALTAGAAYALKTPERRK